MKTIPLAINHMGPTSPPCVARIRSVWVPSVWTLCLQGRVAKGLQKVVDAKFQVHAAQGKASVKAYLSSLDIGFMGCLQQSRS